MSRLATSILAIFAIGSIWITSFPTEQQYLLQNVISQSTPSTMPTTCENGYLAQPRTQFWKYMDKGTPAIADVLTSGDKLYVVINLVVLENYLVSYVTRDWQTAQWKFTFVNHSIPSINATSFGTVQPPNNPNNLILYAVLPPTLLAANPREAIHVDITALLSERTHTYRGVPFCLAPKPSTEPKYFLVACIKCVPVEPWIDLLPEWIVYHIEQGVRHIYLYSVGNPQILHKKLFPFIHIGWVTIVDWEWPDIWVQTYAFSEAHQNACLLRARGIAEWVAFADVDEFWQPRTKTSDGQVLSVAEFLRQPVIHNESALRANTWYFGSSNNRTKQLDISSTARNATMAKYLSRHINAVKGEREKNIVRPEMITYMATHLVARGPQEYLLDPNSQMRVVHYKPQYTFDEIDNSMLRYIHGVRSMLNQFGFQ